MTQWCHRTKIRTKQSLIRIMLCFILEWKGSIFLIKPYFWKNIHKFFFRATSNSKFQMAHPVYGGRLLILIFLTLIQSLAQLHDDLIRLWLWFGHHQLHLAHLNVAHLWMKNPQNRIYQTNFDTLSLRATSPYTSHNFLAAYAALFPLWK